MIIASKLQRRLLLSKRVMLVAALSFGFVVVGAEVNNFREPVISNVPRESVMETGGDPNHREALERSIFPQIGLDYNILSRFRSRLIDEGQKETAEAFQRLRRRFIDLMVEKLEKEREEPLRPGFVLTALERSSYYEFPNAAYYDLSFQRMVFKAVGVDSHPHVNLIYTISGKDSGWFQDMEGMAEGIEEEW